MQNTLITVKMHDLHATCYILTFYIIAIKLNLLRVCYTPNFFLVKFLQSVFEKNINFVSIVEYGCLENVVRLVKSH